MVVTVLNLMTAGLLVLCILILAMVLKATREKVLMLEIRVTQLQLGQAKEKDDEKFDDYKNPKGLYTSKKRVE